MKSYVIYLRDIDNDGSNFSLNCEDINCGEIINFREGLFSLEDVFIDLYDFYKECCKLIKYDSRYMSLEIKLEYKVS